VSCIFRSGSIRNLGGKAHALARLETSGLPVPEWFAVAPEALEHSLSIAQREMFLSGDMETIRGLIPDLHPAPEVTQEIVKAVCGLPGDCFAVRSSAVEEDGAEDSFAGQLASYLFVAPQDVVRRVADVWRSGFGDRITEYRRQRGLPASPAVPAVLVQRMVRADCAGVAFSADPVSGRRGVAVVSAVYGMGTSLVGGEADADAYLVNRNGAIEQTTIAHKEIQHSFDARTEEGVAAAPVPDSLRDQPVLTDGQAAAVAAMARRAAAYFGQPQDIEWALEGGRLYLLQSRPITTLRNLPDPDGALNIWDNSNIIESYSGLTTPLTFSFARSVYEGVYRQFCFILKVPRKKIAANDRTFSRMLGLIKGRVYYNLLNWYHVLALLPGFTVNRRFMEQMMGVREPLPEEIAAALGAASKRERVADLFSLVGMTFALAKNLFTLERQIERFLARLNDALQEPAPALSEMRLDELTAYYSQLEEKLLRHWDAPLINDFFAMIFHGALRKLTGKWLGDETGMLANDAIRGEGGIVSAEPAARVRELAQIAAADSQLTQCLCEGSMEEALRCVAGHAVFHLRYRAYIEKFGDRCLEELKLESQTLDENPMVLLRSVGELARAGSPASQHPGVQTQNFARDAEEKIRSGLHSSPLRRALLAWVLRNARTRVRQRENLRFERTRLFGRVRRIFREAGRRLHTFGVLQSPEDVFYLQVEEILAYVDGTAVTANLSALAVLRKAEFAQYKTEDAPPERFETTGPVYGALSYRTKTEAPGENAAGELRSGIGCCPGVVRGMVKVIRDPRGARLPAGRILVAAQTDPGWIMLFPSAIGLLVERGSLLSHSAIVARELGIPAVVSIRGLTEWLCDGDLVELDGARGTVRRIASEAGRAE
jgi:phosphohistidine swiveling domain-containing protein